MLPPHRTALKYVNTHYARCCCRINCVGEHTRGTVYVNTRHALLPSRRKTSVSYRSSNMRAFTAALHGLCMNTRDAATAPHITKVCCSRHVCCCHRRNNGVGDHEHSMVCLNTCHVRCCRCIPWRKWAHVARAAVATAAHSVVKHVSHRVTHHTRCHSTMSSYRWAHVTPALLPSHHISGRTHERSRRRRRIA